MEVNELITEALTAKEEVIAILFKIRNQIATLTTLREKFPDSKEIPHRMQDCDETIIKGREQLEIIADQLARYDQLIKDIDSAIEQDNPPSLHTATFKG